MRSFLIPISLLSMIQLFLKTACSPLSALVFLALLPAAASAHQPQLQNSEETPRQDSGALISIRRGEGFGVQFSLQGSSARSIYVECFSYTKLNKSCGCSTSVSWEDCIKSVITTSYTVDQYGRETYVLDSGSPTWIRGLRFACMQEQQQQCQQQ